jgi:hypothetical protein
VQKSSARFFFVSSSQQPSHFDTLMDTFSHDRKKKKKKNKSIVTQKLIAAEYVQAFLSFWSMRNRCQVSQFDSFKALIV